MSFLGDIYISFLFNGFALTRPNSGCYYEISLNKLMRFFNQRAWVGYEAEKNKIFSG